MWYYMLLPKILNMSLTAGIVVVLVLLARLPLKKAPKVFSYVLWAVVLFRLLCPVSFSSDFSLLGIFNSPNVTNGSITYVPADIVHAENPQVNLLFPGISQAINETLPQGDEQTVADPLEAPMAIATFLWLFGIAVMLTYSVVSVLLLKKRLKSARNTVGNIYEADNLKTPFVLGVIRPRIFIPTGLSVEEKSYIIRHEQTHIRRFDHIIKPFAFFVLSIHWFNPLVWIAFVVMGADMELSCDERVIKEMGGDIKKAYSVSLLSLATEKRIINGSPLAFGEGNVGGRIKNVLNYKKPALWIIAAAVIACIAVSVCLLSNPRARDDASRQHPYAEQLFENRTSYVGDNSAVAGIVNLLIFPADVAYDHIELQTASEPYGVEVYFRVTPEVEAAYDQAEPENIDVFRINACIMLSLIENADKITFRMDDGTENTVDLIFTREWAEGIVGIDLWKESGSVKRLDSLIMRINEHVENAYASAENISAEELPEGTFEPAEVVHLGHWVNVTPDYFLENNKDRTFVIKSGLFRDDLVTYRVLYELIDVGDNILTFGDAETISLDVSGYRDKAGWRVMTTSGGDTGYRIFRMDDDLWIGHWGWYGSNNDAWWCDYIFRVELEKGGGSAVTGQLPT